MTSDVGGARLARPNWPFWAPASTRAVTRALRMAHVGPGTRFMDIGCGDGRVLVAAAKLGADVTGVETDADLVGWARQALADASLPGTVIHGDASDVALAADVIYAYLSPGTLQRLRPRFAAAEAGTRLVTVDYAVPNALPTRTTQGIHMYRLPLQPAPPSATAGGGWPSEGSLIAVVADCHSLTALDFVHPGGAVSVIATGNLTEAAEIETGSDVSMPNEVVALDVRWRELPPATLVAGHLRVSGLDGHLVVALVDDHDAGVWELSDVGCRNLTAWLAGRDRTATPSIATLVSAATGL